MYWKFGARSIASGEFLETIMLTKIWAHSLSRLGTVQLVKMEANFSKVAFVKIPTRQPEQKHLLNELFNC
jgi:hypothetical protein